MPNRLCELVARTAAVTELRETADALVFHAPLGGDDRHEWLALRDARPPFASRIFITDAHGDTPLERDLEPVEDELFRVTVRKAAEPECLLLFFSASLGSCAGAVEAARHVRIADMTGAETFATMSARHQAWTEEPALTFAPSEPLADPRSFVKDFTGRAVVPADVRPWLLQAAPQLRGAAFEAWLAVATEKLLPCLADQVSVDDGRIRHHFVGPPRQVMSLTAEEAAALAEGVQAAARWVFAEGRDAEPRHVLLSAEWTRAYRPDRLAEVGARSLESAKVGYVAFVRSGSKETLKAIAELRKGVVEETQKASQRAQELAGALWKDLAVASAPFVLKVLPDSAKAGGVAVSAGLAFGAALFLAYSFGVQAHINGRFFRTQAESRAVWRDALTTVLSTDEVTEYSDKPIRNSIADYRWIRNLVGMIYGALCLGLIAFGAVEMRSAMSGDPHPKLAPGGAEGKPHDWQAPRTAPAAPAGRKGG